MKDKPFPLPQHIIDCLNTNYGIATTALLFLPIGADRNVSIYKAERLGGPPYFVKLKRGHCDEMSIAILALLQASGIQHIIPPIKTTNGKFDLAPFFSPCLARGSG